MKSIMSRSPYESSFSFSRRHFHRIIAKVELAVSDPTKPPRVITPLYNRIKTAISSALARRSSRGPRLVGTLFGRRRGHVRFAFQLDPRAPPAILVELAMPTASLVKEMSSGLVRIALESERTAEKLSEERSWRAFCNGKKCGYAVRRDCGEADWRVLRAVEVVSMGAGVLPAAEEKGDDEELLLGEMMYMRARFERVVGSNDSEAFYMMNPDGSGAPELSIYLLRVSRF